MRIIDADALINEIKKETEKAIEQDDRVGSFWLGYIAGLVIKQPTIQPEDAQLSKEGATSDLISRQALCEYALNQKDKSVTPNDIMRFPSAQPEPQEGHWIDKGWDGDWAWQTDGRGNCWRVIECSECGKRVLAESNYCPHCGAKMKGEANE